MKKICTILVLLFLFLPSIATAATEGKLQIIKADGTIKTEKEMKEDGSYAAPSDDDTNENTTEEDSGGILESTIIGAQTAFENALEGFTHTIINQLMEGSVSLYGSEAEESDGSVTYTIKYKVVNPFEPDFVVTVLVWTLGFLICLIFFVMVGSNLLLIAQETYPDEFSEMRESFTGESGLYTSKHVRLATLISIGSILFSFIMIFLITGTRNLIIYTVTPNGITIPNLAGTTIPDGALVGLSSFSNAVESNVGLYCIYVFAAACLIYAGICSFLGMLGALDNIVQFSKFYWGAYALFNFIDIISLCFMSAGVYMYIDTGNENFVKSGIVVGAIFIIILFYLIFLQLKQMIPRRG